MSTTFRTRIKLAFVYIFFIVLLFVFFNPFSSSNLNSFSYRYGYISSVSDNDFFSLNPGDTIIQSFELDYNSSLNFFDIAGDFHLFSENETPPLSVHISLNGKDFFVVSDITVMNKEWIRVPLIPDLFDNISDSRIKIWFKLVNNSLSEPIALNFSFNTSSSSVFSMNNEPLNNSLVVRSVLNGSPDLYICLWILVLMFGLLCCMCINGVNLRSYLLLSIPFGLMFVLYSVYPSVYEQNTALLAFNHFYYPSFLSVNNISWMPSGLINKLSAFSVTSDFFDNDYSVYNIPFGFSIPLIEWIYYPVIYFAKSANLNNLYLFFALRIYNLVLCILFNAFAVANARKNKSIIFSCALLPFTISLFSGFSSAGLIVSFFNVLLSMIYSRYQDFSAQDNTHRPITAFKTIILFALLFIVSTYSLLLGSLILCSVFFVDSKQVLSNKKILFVCVCVIAYFAAISLDVVYLIMNKNALSIFIDPFNEGLQSLFTNPVSTLSVSSQNIFVSFLIALNNNISSVVIVHSAFIGLLSGILLFLHSKSRLILKIEQSYNNESASFTEKRGSLLTVISIVILALFTAFSAVFGWFFISRADALICPVFAFVLSTVCCRKDYDRAIFDDNAIPFVLLMFVSAFLLSGISIH